MRHRFCTLRQSLQRSVLSMELEASQSKVAAVCLFPMIVYFKYMWLLGDTTITDCSESSDKVI